MNYNPPTPTTQPPAQGLSITALVLGCVSIVFFWLYGITPILAIVFGGIAISKQRKVGAKPNGMAVAGLTLGIVFTVIAAFLWLAILGASGN